MKVYSDVLTPAMLADALPPDVTFASMRTIQRPRVRARGWEIHLEGLGARHTRRVNSGEYGAGYHAAATYDDHGWWMAALFAIDPDARISWWYGANAFHAGTEYKYASLEEASRVGVTRALASDPERS